MQSCGVIEKDMCGNPTTQPLGRFSTRIRCDFEQLRIVFLQKFLDGLEARVSGGILNRDIVLQVLDSFFLFRDNPLH
jgi:hypothetical protein